MQETGPTIFRPYSRRLECLTGICRCKYKDNTFSSVILRPWVLVLSGAPTLDLPHCMFCVIVLTLTEQKNYKQQKIKQGMRTMCAQLCRLEHRRFCCFSRVQHNLQREIFNYKWIKQKDERWSKLFPIQGQPIHIIMFHMLTTANEKKMNLYLFLFLHKQCVYWSQNLFELNI